MRPAGLLAGLLAGARDVPAAVLLAAGGRWPRNKPDNVKKMVIIIIIVTIMATSKALLPTAAQWPCRGRANLPSSSDSALFILFLQKFARERGTHEDWNAWLRYGACALRGQKEV